jgi:hypothetical protein
MTSLFSFRRLWEYQFYLLPRPAISQISSVLAVVLRYTSDFYQLLEFKLFQTVHRHLGIVMIPPRLPGSYVRTMESFHRIVSLIHPDV